MHWDLENETQLALQTSNKGFSQARLARGSFKINGSKELRLLKQVFILYIYIFIYTYIHILTFSCVSSLVNFHFFAFSCVASRATSLLNLYPLRFFLFLHVCCMFFLLMAGATEAIETCNGCF